MKKKQTLERLKDELFTDQNFSSALGGAPSINTYYFKYTWDPDGYFGDLHTYDDCGRRVCIDITSKPPVAV